MKKILFAILILITGATTNLRADEGMWLPFLVNRLNHTDMQKMGLQLTAEEIYSANHSSLKDAIVIFGRGCTGEMISKEGLLLTNHHCGYGSIQQVSTVRDNHLKNGFWATNKQEEIPVEGLTVKFLVRIDPATDKVLEGVTPYMNEEERATTVRKNIKGIVEETKKGNDYKVIVKEFFEGNEYYTFVYEEFNDVRLVGTPPECIGKFGSDTDNWMWPRHTADFSMFRVYAGKDNKPAAFSKDNVPYQPKHFLPINIGGVKEGDFTMIMGNPGSTERYLTSYGIESAITKKNPNIVKVRRKKLDVMDEDMTTDESVRLKYASKRAGIANYWKYFIGQTKSLKKLKVADQKRAIEAEFTQWVNSSEENKKLYGQVLSDIEEAHDKRGEYTPALIYYREGPLRGVEIYGFARTLAYYVKELAKHENGNDQIKAAAKEAITKHFKDYNQGTDIKLMAELLSMMNTDLPEILKPSIIETINKKYKGDYLAYAKKVFSKSVFSTEEKALALLDNRKAEKIVSKDPAYKAIKSIITDYRDLSKKTQVADDMLKHARRLFIKGLREMGTDKKYYPDANFTMRLTYGSVKGYSPFDAINYNYYTTLKGVMEKEDAEVAEFNVPEKLKEIYKNKDYGRYGEGDVMKTCFLTNLDITGGNSGSPVINGKGELIGLAFDGNWEAMSGDIYFNPKVQRCINVDARYLLLLIDKFAGAKNIIEELTIVK
ncbi:MAG: S46 family peptidase [Hyphomicrobiales bacterium]